MGESEISVGGLAAADEVHNFEGVAGLHWRSVPFGARQNIEIALDGHAFVAHAQMFEHGGDVQAVRNFLQFPIDLDIHWNFILLRFGGFCFGGLLPGAHRKANFVFVGIGFGLNDQREIALAQGRQRELNLRST